MALGSVGITRGDNNERDKSGRLRDKSGQLRDKSGQLRDKSGQNPDKTGHVAPIFCVSRNTLRSVKTAFFPGFSGVAPIRWPELDQPAVGYKRQKNGKRISRVPFSVFAVELAGLDTIMGGCAGDDRREAV